MGGGPRIESGDAVVASVGCPAVEFASVEPTVELPSVVPLVFGGWQVRATDLEVGGRYRIPRKQKK